MSIGGESVVEIADAFAKGEQSAEALTQAALRRLETVGVELNAVVALDSNFALEGARKLDQARAANQVLGRLAGVPMAHKDLLYRTGRLAECGAPLRRGFVPTQTATVLSRLDSAGAIDLGRLQMAEFAMSPTGFNGHYGHPLNPWNTAHIPGGSSSGSGVAVASGCIPAALGSDTGGSIRLPSAMCGITGIKATATRVSVAGVMPLSWTLDCIGPLARTARDCARLLTVLAGADDADGYCSTQPVPDYEAGLDGDLRGMRIAHVGGYYEATLDPAVAERLAEARQVFEQRGAVFVQTDVSNMDLINAMSHVVMTVEAATLHRQWLTDSPDQYSPQVRGRMEPGLYYPATRYAEALCLREKLARKWLEEAMQDCDLALLPLMPRSVPSIAETSEGDESDIAAVITQMTHCTRGINYLGLPAMSVPCGFTAGLPVALQLVGHPFDEATLLKAADGFQLESDFHRQVPVVQFGSAGS